MAEPTGIQCKRCKEAELVEPEPDAQFECPNCGAVVAQDIAKRHQYD